MSRNKPKSENDVGQSIINTSRLGRSTEQQSSDNSRNMDNKDMIVTDTESRKTTDNGGKTIMFPEDGDMVNDGQPITSY